MSGNGHRLLFSKTAKLFQFWDVAHRAGARGQSVLHGKHSWAQHRAKVDIPLDPVGMQYLRAKIQ